MFLINTIKSSVEKKFKTFKKINNSFVSFYVWFVVGNKNIIKNK